MMGKKEKVINDHLIDLEYDLKSGGYFQKNSPKNVYLRDTIINTISLDDVLDNLGTR